MLYTGKGDNGTTKLFDCPSGVRLRKSDFIFEALGNLDELNCNIGYAKALSVKSKDTLSIDGQKFSYTEILEKIQQNIFCIQAEVGGADIHPTKNQVTYLEKILYEIETLLPPIKSFIVPGGGETGAYLDVCRTNARKTERCLVLILKKKTRIISSESLVFLNRLSSTLYALARFANYQEGYVEQKPNYQ